MFSFRELALALVLSAAGAAAAQSPAYPALGRAATPKEIAAWDIDVRPDFKGLPAGAGSVAKGMDVWEAKCASCHGIFGESNEFFAPIVGGTTKDDIKTGRVARLNDPSFPGRTTLMKLSSVSTLWDYINRAMPWMQPKSLSTEEVYAVTAYILNMGGVVPDSFTLSDQNIAEVQKLLPNRNGMTTEHALWPGASLGKRKPDVQAVACMKDCVQDVRLASFLPDFARDAHGNLAEQNRAVGAQKGADTSKPAAAATLAQAGAAPAAASGGAAAIALTQKYTCVACHGMDSKILGPSFRDIAKKYAGGTDALGYLAGKIKAGGTGVWGSIPMPAQALSAADAKIIAEWLADGAKK
jgi:S-disulfanyl-L-cysteine oxidoreductase SoxD